MKLMGLVPILLLLGVGITSGIAAGQVSVGAQVVPPTAHTGEIVSVMLSLSKPAGDAVEVTVMPNLPPGVSTNMLEPWKVPVMPGSNPTPISYLIWAEQPGNYIVTTSISYVDESGQPTNLNMLAPFNVVTLEAPEGADNSGTGPDFLPNVKGTPEGGLPENSGPFGNSGAPDQPPGNLPRGYQISRPGSQHEPSSEDNGSQEPKPPA